MSEPTPLAAERVTELLPRATFADITQWPGWDYAPDDQGDETWVSVLMPEGWNVRITTTDEERPPVKILQDSYGRARFAVLVSGLVSINEEDAARY